MKRLISKYARSAMESFRHKRFMRIAEWVDADVNDPELVQQITDIMASGGQIQIQYKGEWKLISPYGWNSSQEGNVLLMCYKDTGEVRSYRLDRIEAVQMDSSQINSDSTDSSDLGLDTPNDLGVELPESDNEIQDVGPNEELPFDDELEILDDEVVEQPIQTKEVPNTKNTEDLDNPDNQEETEEENKAIV